MWYGRISQAKPALKSIFRRRAAIEHTIGQMKSDRYSSGNIDWTFNTAAISKSTGSGVVAARAAKAMP
jgi:hypothetical protein